jgi:pimeloyl-ACP methyl ester carboxylesterase
MKEIILRSYLFVLVIIICHVIVKPTSAGTSSVDSGFIEVKDGRIFYEAAGTGPAIIMIHDGILHRETWDAQFDVFSKRYRVIRWDRRGYGRSDSPKEAFSNLEDLLALMNSLKIDRATLMGCSSGGLLSIDFTLEHPERVASLILVDPIISGFGFTDHFYTRGERGYPKADAPVADRIEYWARIDPWITAPESKAAKDQIEMLLTPNPQNLSGSGRYARGPGRAAMGLLPEIKVPTLIIAGESDIPDVHAHIGVIQAGIAGSRRVVLARCGHLAHFEVPDVFNKVVLDFLKKIE